MTTSALGYILLGVCLTLSYLNTSFHLLVWDEMPYVNRFSVPLLQAPRKRLIPVVLGAILLLPAIVAFSLDLGSRPVAAAWIFVGLGLYRQVDTGHWEGNTVTRLGRYVPSATAVFGWLIGWTLASGEPALVRERLGVEVACGLLAGAMMMAGIRKVEKGGWLWFGSTGLTLMLAERLQMGPAPLRALRRLMLTRPTAVNLLGGITVWVEVVCIAFAIPALRVPSTVVLVLTVIGIMALLGYLELEWLMIYVALALMGTGLPLYAT